MPRRRRRLASRVRGYIRALLAFLFSNIGVIVLVVGYTIAGAFMFQAIEGASETERANNMTRERENFTQHLWHNVTLALNLFNETALREKISINIQEYQQKVVGAVKRGWDGGRSSRQWSFSSAFLYSLTVITTIGYGHLSPRTNWGKVMTIFYALLGMPLFLLYLSNVGELLARWFKCVYALVCLCRGCPGFGGRRLRPPIEISEAESIERPAAWRSRYSDSDVTPEYGVRYYPQNPYPKRDYPPYQRGYPPYQRDYQPHQRDYYDRDYPAYPHRDYPPYPQRGVPGRRPDYLRSISMPYPPAPRAPLPPRAASAGYQPESDVTSEFSYVTFDAQTITVPISVCVTIMVGYLMFGSMIFGLWEKWNQLDGAYFCFISLSSIGFGDFVPGERVYTARIETSFIVCSMYLMLGMALVAMCFNLMQEQVIHYFAAIKRALKRICRCKR